MKNQCSQKKWKVFLYNEVSERTKVLSVFNSEKLASNYARILVKFFDGVDVVVCIQPFTSEK